MTTQQTEPSPQVRTTKGKTTPPTAVVACVVFLGGALGSAVRGVCTVIPPLGITNPFISMGIVNTLGAFILGLSVALFGRRVKKKRQRPLLIPFLHTGVLGGFTSFSAVAALAGSFLVWTPTGTSDGSSSMAIIAAAGIAIAVMLLNLLCGVVAAFVGFSLGGGRK